MLWQDGLTIAKDPQAVKDYKWDFAPWIAQGDAIFSHVATPEAGIVVDASAHDTNSVTVWLSGGTSGETYAVKVSITTNDGRTEEKTVNFYVDEQ